MTKNDKHHDYGHSACMQKSHMQQFIHAYEPERHWKGLPEILKFSDHDQKRDCDWSQSVIADRDQW